MENNKLKVNTILHTKDGRKIGNAIIVAKNDNCYKIKTDYGNIINCMTSSEIEEDFYIAWVDYTKDTNMYSFEDMQEYMSSNHKHRV